MIFLRYLRMPRILGLQKKIGCENFARSLAQIHD